MRNHLPTIRRLPAALLSAALAIAIPAAARAHCDTLDGPVVAAARAALESSSVAPALAWIQPEHEAQIRALFAEVLRVRALDEGARDLADRLFFETLVRLHREGEGFPFTGLKPTGTTISRAVRDIDAALERGSIEEPRQALETALGDQLQVRFDRALEDRKHSGDDVAAGRRFVASYVELAHFAEELEALSAGHASTPETSSSRSDPGHD